MGKLKDSDTCITRIDIMKPINIEVVNLLIDNNSNSYLLMRKRMLENIRRGQVREALTDAEIISSEAPAIENKLITARLWLCLGETAKAIRELDACIECSESCSSLLEITKTDADFIDVILNKLDGLDTIRQDYIIQSLTSLREEYMWVDFMPYIISLLNNNSDEAREWLNILKKNGKKTCGKLAQELLTNELNLFHNRNEYRGLYYFVQWAVEKNIEYLEKVVENTYFPEGIYIFSKAIMTKRNSIIE